MTRRLTLALALVIGGSVPSAHANLVAYYPFNGGSYDATGKNINLTLVGNAGFAPSVNAGLGSALSLDGDDDGAIGQNFSKILTNNLSGVAWVHATSLAGDWNSIVKNWGSMLPGQFHFGLGPAGANTLHSIVGGGATVIAPSNLPANQWVHVAFVADAAAHQHRLYLNGQVIATSGYSGTLDLGAATGLGIGHKPNDNGTGLALEGAGPWTGFIDEVGLYNVALTTAQIQEIYQNGLAGIPLAPPPSGNKRFILQGIGENPANIDVTESGGAPTATVTLGRNLSGTQVTAQPGTPGEVVSNLVDNFVFYDGPAPNLAKWNDAQGDTIMLPVHLQLDQPRTVRYYTLTSANDAPERDPWRWRLLGTNVTNPTSVAHFTLLEERTGVEFSGRNQTQLFDLVNKTAYRTYRFEFETELVAGGPMPGGANSIQLSEIELFENMQFAGPMVRVNRTNGAVTLTNVGTSPLTMTGYSITSAQGLLNADAWLSIADNYDGDDGAEIDSDMWLRFTEPSGNSNLSEAEDPNGNGGASLVVGQTINLGNAWIVNPVQDLLAEISFADGTTRSLMVEYFEDPSPLPGDYNSNNKVDAADYVVWRKLLGTNTPLPNEGVGVTPGMVTPEDYGPWRNNFGDSLAGSSSAVPEPDAWIVALLLPFLVLAVRSRERDGNRSQRMLIAAMVIVSSCVVSMTHAETVDRDYLFGDDALEHAQVGQIVGQSSIVANHTLDSASQGSFFDIPQNGSPKYANVGPVASGGTGRPGALAGHKGIQFTGSSSQYLTGRGFGAPREGGALANPPINTYPDSRIMQIWARPTLDTGARQDIVNDTFQFGIHITANDTWGHTFGGSGGVGAAFDTGAAVAYNQWTHIMQRTFGRSGVVVYINGVAVSRFNGAYLETTLPANDHNIYVGANLGATGSFFTGQLDNLKIAVADVFFHRPPSEPIPVFWGNFDLATDNEYVASLNLVPGDVNGDGVVNGTGSGPAGSDDVRFFIDHWLDERQVNGIVVGDLISRTTMADINFDGRTTLADWSILRSAHVGGASLDLAALLEVVPEPSTTVSAVFAFLSISGIAWRPIHRGWRL